MSVSTPISELPLELGPFEAVATAYPVELSRAHQALVRGLPVLVECDKGLSPYFYKCLRDRLKHDGITAVYLDGRPVGDGPPMGLIATIIAQLRDAVRGSVDRRLIVLPHLDLLTSSNGGLTSDAKEVIPLLYENPTIRWLGFRDPSFAVPQVIENLFPHKISILGVPRDRLHQLVTQKECRKLGSGDFHPYELYQMVSGLNAVRLRSVLAALHGEDYPLDTTAIRKQLREATANSDLAMPDIDLRRDIGGYTSVKERIQREILDILVQKAKLDDPNEIERIESLVPRGIIFSGPPGTGKTLFAKAMATALGAAVQVVSGPELKSRWVGESEHRLRQLFIKARQSAPSLIIFDELDSFAAARGTYTGSGVEHSLVNQLLTEMDGFRANEMVFVVGTTNFVESIDPALLRPGRFEFHIPVPYPNEDDREAIFRIYDRKLGLKLSEEALDYAVKRTGAPVEHGGLHTGDHLQALCRAVARQRLRDSYAGSTDIMQVERALTDNLDRPKLSAEEEMVVATHEAGHAIVALHCEHAPPIERISIRGDVPGALGAVSYSNPANRYVVTRAQLYDRIAILFGGREAELAILGDLSLGAGRDLERATEIARSAVEGYGMSDDVVVRDFVVDRDSPLSEATRAAVDTAIHQLLDAQRKRATGLIAANRDSLLALRDLLLAEKVIDRVRLTALREER